MILALVLVFALVACGNKDDNKGGGGGGGGQTTPTKDTTNVKNYFNTLWEKSTGIGGEAIGKNDLKVSLDLAVALDLVDRNGKVMTHSISASHSISFLTDQVALTRAPTLQSKPRSMIPQTVKTGLRHTISSMT